MPPIASTAAASDNVVKDGGVQRLLRFRAARRRETRGRTVLRAKRLGDGGGGAAGVDYFRASDPRELFKFQVFGTHAPRRSPLRARLYENNV